MGKFLKKYKLPKTESGIENLNRTITSKWNWISNQKLPTDKSPIPDGFTAQFYHTFIKELIPILFKLFQKTEEEGMLPNSAYKASIALISKLDSQQQQQKLDTSIPDEHRYKILKQNKTT